MSNKNNNKIPDAQTKAALIQKVDSRLAQLRQLVKAPVRPEAWTAAPAAASSQGSRLNGAKEGNGVARLAGGGSQAVRTTTHGVVARAVSSPVGKKKKLLASLPKTLVSIKNKAGVQVASIPHYYHPSAETMGPGIAQAMEHGPAEHERIDAKKGRSVRAVGRLYLDTVKVLTIPPATTVDVGCNLGIYPIAPTAFGERLEILANTFEQNRVHKLRIEYEPSVASTESGSIAMFARNDTTAPLYVTGTDLLRHAATHESFKQAQVWEKTALDINPNDIMKEYFDGSSGETRLTLQGEFQVLSSSELKIDVAYGNLYVVYDIEFFSEELDFDESEVPSGTGFIKFTNATITHGQPIVPYLSSAVAPPSVSAQLPNGFDSAAYVVYGVIIGQNITVGAIPPVAYDLSVVPSDGTLPQVLKNGQGFVALIYDPDGTFDVANSVPSLALFWDFEEGDQTNVWNYANSATFVNGRIEFVVRGMKRME